MTIALAECLVADDGLDEDHLAARFAATFCSDPHRGYGAGTAHLLAAVAAGADWRPAAAAQFEGAGSLGNGAAMRVAPVAVHARGHVPVAVAFARRAAAVTHTHPIGIEGASIQAAAVALVLRSDPATPIDGPSLCRALAGLTTSTELFRRLGDAAAICERHAPEQVAQRLGTSVSALDSVPAAVCAFALHPESFVDAVRFAISLGGDTDTIASMAAAIAGARHGLQAIPERWTDRAEGAQVLIGLADRLTNPGGRRRRP
jgi:poly(ADP-ribose) glycohydrolase ARH3